MDTTTLGRTGLKVSVAGLGCGGFSRIGIKNGIEHAAGIVRAAYGMGITFFDTAAAYGTERAVGEGLRGIRRESYALSTKFTYKTDTGPITAEQMNESLDRSLRELGTDYIDVFHIHALTAGDFGWARDSMLPELIKAKERGKIRFLGVTELFGTDTSHEMFKAVLPEDMFDVIMVGHNMLNPSAVERVLPCATKNNAGTLCMFAVRNALWNREVLEREIETIIVSGQGGDGLNKNSLDFLTGDGVAKTLTEAAYRFCRHTKGLDVILTGTGNLEHLEENVRSINMPPLPDDALGRLNALFGKSDCVSGQ